METNFSLKDDLFNRDTVEEMAKSIKSVYQAFDEDTFIQTCINGFESRELKERMSYICTCLKDMLPEDFYQATEIMLESCKISQAEESFVYGAFSEYVEIYGCSDVHLKHSLKMLGEYTKVFSAEFAIRRFINEYPEETFKQMIQWSKSKDFDQRRLASEGLRAKLPWASKIEFDPIRATEPLQNLYYDKERYVTRSVANHLNDLSKIDPETVIEILKKWQASGKQEEKEMAYIISHSSRTLIKKCHVGALELQGYKADAKIDINGFCVATPEIQIGESLEFEFELSTKEDLKLMIDYKIDYPMAGGKRSTKVFKIKKTSLKKGEKMKVGKKHPFKVMTTKKLYSGDYRVSLQVNGKIYAEGSFKMEV